MSIIKGTQAQKVTKVTPKVYPVQGKTATSQLITDRVASKKVTKSSKSSIF